MEENLIKIIDLENNLKLEIYDISKKMAGDRWLVSILARIKIPVNPESGLFSGSEWSKEEIIKLLGNEAVFEQKRERYFIDEKNKQFVFNELCDSFVNNTISYLSHPDFPKKFAVMKLKEKIKKASLEAAVKKFRSESN
jgi:hypothetical protein